MPSLIPLNLVLPCLRTHTHAPFPSFLNLSHIRTIQDPNFLHGFNSDLHPRPHSASMCLEICASAMSSDVVADLVELAAFLDIDHQALVGYGNEVAGDVVSAVGNEDGTLLDFVSGHVGFVVEENSLS